MSQAINWCFTVFDCNVKPFDWERAEIRYCVWQLETCPSSGRDHLQGFLQLTTKKRLSFLKTLNSTAHWEIARGTVDENYAYCTKPESRKEGPWSFGEPVKKGERSDLKRCMQLIQEGTSVDELLLTEPTALTHTRGLRDMERVVKRNRARDQFMVSDLRPWQSKIMDMLSSQSDRQVLWVCDPTGNSGKTYLSNVLEFKHNFQCFTGGKFADLAYAVDPERAGYVIDLARCSEEFVCYNFMEQLKNRRVFSTKYDSGTKYLRSGKLVVFSNFPPLLDKLSRDRWQLVELVLTPLSEHHALIEKAI